MLMATAVSSMPGTFPGHSHGPYNAPPNFAHLLNYHLNALQHLMGSQVQDCKFVNPSKLIFMTCITEFAARGRDVELAMDLAQYHGPRVHSHRNRRSVEGYGDGYG